MRILAVCTTAAAVAVVLAACAGGETVTVPPTKDVEVPVPCIPAGKAPEKPALRTEADLLAMDQYRRTLAAWSELQKLWAYAPQLEALVDGCSRLPATKPP